jgi:hypothetical protein
MSKSLNQISDFTDAFVYFTPTTFYCSQNNSFLWQISSSAGVLTSYGYNLSINSDPIISFSGTNALGGLNQSSLYGNCTGSDDVVYLTYFYTTSYGAVRVFSAEYTPVGTSSTNQTFIKNINSLYGLGDFERTIIATIMTIVIAGVAMMFGGILIGLALGLLMFGYFYWIGLLSWYVMIIPVIIGVIYIIGRRE